MGLKILTHLSFLQASKMLETKSSFIPAAIKGQICLSIMQLIQLYIVGLTLQSTGLCYLACAPLFCSVPQCDFIARWQRFKSREPCLPDVVDLFRLC